jgi:hypothetical protein
MSGGKTSALGKEVSGRYVLLPLSKRALYSEFCGHPNTATERQRASLSNFEPLVAHRLVGLKFAGCALEYYPSVTHHIDTVGYPQGDRQLLFD